MRQETLYIFSKEEVLTALREMTRNASITQWREGGNGTLIAIHE